MSDLISRQLLISKLANSTVKFATYDDWEHCCDVIESVEREKGEWLLQDDRTKKRYGWYICSECGAWIGEPTNFCSNCGSDMRKEEKNEQKLV